MNLLIKNIKTSQAFKFKELLWVFCVLFSTASILLRNTDFKFEKQQDNLGFKLNKNYSHQNFKTTLPANPLSDFDFIEESETTDDSNEDDIIEGHYSPNTQTFFTYNISQNSSVSYSLYLHKRVFILLFLLHHSWKIPVA